jgi:hypothetical protein
MALVLVVLLCKLDLMGRNHNISYVLRQKMNSPCFQVIIGIDGLLRKGCLFMIYYNIITMSSANQFIEFVISSTST